MSSQIDSYLEAHKQDFENDLFELLKIPSVSTDSHFEKDVHDAANWIVRRFEKIGFSTQLVETCGHPIVLAESPAIEGAPVVLVYGHYDVQPPDPLDQWVTPPFEPSVRDGNVYARGATDDKGQMLTHLFSTEAWMETEGRLPVQLKFLIEGEEECGSKGLWEFLDGKYDTESFSALERVKCDVAVISDCSQYAPGKPAITYGLKGICYFELLLRGPNQDLHSGSFGGAVTNPGNTICQMMSSMIDDEGRIQIPGFYDDVIDLTERERAEFAELNFDDDEFKAMLDVEGLSGELGYTTLERRWARPTFDVNGLWSGYQGEGAKTVLPAEAGAKFSFRLVPSQDPRKITDSLKSMLKKQCPHGITMELIDRHGAPGILVPLDSPFMDAASRAIESGFGTRPVFIRAGGSIPVVNAFSGQLGVDTLLLGWGLDDDNTHSPNEKFNLADFHRGIQSSARLWAELGKIAV